MSATLDGMALERLLPGAPVVRSEGRGFPDPVPRSPRQSPAVAGAPGWRRAGGARQSGWQCPGVPAGTGGDRAAGTAAGRAVARGCDPRLPRRPLTRPSKRPSSLRLRVVASWCSPPTWRHSPHHRGDLRGHRQRIGAARHLRYRSGVTRLETRPIAKASATQRAGRAGRLARRLLPALELRGAGAPRRAVSPTS